jgi:hypothetical protein
LDSPAGFPLRLYKQCVFDLLTTLGHLTGAPLPENKIDDLNVWELIKRNPEAKNPHKFYPVSTKNQLEAVISGDGRWKLHLPHTYRVIQTQGNDGMDAIYGQEKIELSLFDLENDPYEKHNVIADHPEIADQLLQLAKQHQATFYKHMLKKQ